MASTSGRSMTGWGRGRVAIVGAIVLAVSLVAQVALAFLLTLCGLSETEPAPGTWCAASDRLQAVVIFTPMVVSIAAYAWTVWRVRLTPVLLGGPVFTVVWVLGLFAVFV
jgi:hypothetical protein